ncbi:MAG: LysR substrate-binding domain-containing protein [Pseudomonadota bacterium]
MRDLPLSQLRALAALRATGGVRPAARLLGVRHSSVSRAVRDLETWVGALLLEPGRRGARARLTQQGAELADAALASFAGLERAAETARQPSSAMRVVIAAPPSIATRWLFPRLPGIEADCPGVQLSISVDTARMGDLDPYADLSLRMGARTSANGLIHIVASDVAVPVMSPAAWEAAGRPNAADDLLQLALLHDRDQRTAWPAWRAVHGPATLNTRDGPRFTSADLVLRAAEQGRGIALTRRWLAADALGAGQLIRPFGGLHLPLRDEWWLAERRDPPLRAAGRKVRDWILAQTPAAPPSP